MKNQALKFAVIGYGHIGKRHAEVISMNPDATLVGIADIRPKEITGGNKYNVPYYQSLASLLKSEQEIDVVNIATPNGLHAQQAIDVLSSNIHVVIEKPMALTKHDAELIINQSKKVNKHVFCVMQNRYSPPSVWIKQLIEDGLLGNIYKVSLNCFWNRDERYYQPGNWHGTKSLDGGTLFTQFSHFIDLVYWLFGDITNIYARFNNFNHGSLIEFEDSGSVLFDFVNGGEGSIQYSTTIWDSNLESSMTIIAENGSVKIGGQYMDKVEYCHVKNYIMPKIEVTNPGNDYGYYKGSAQNHHFVIQNVINVLQRNERITTNASEGLKVVEMIERIYSNLHL